MIVAYCLTLIIANLAVSNSSAETKTIKVNDPDFGSHFSSNSLSSVYIRVGDSTGKKIGNATGFFVKRNGDYYFITNWHVATNRNPRDSSLKSKDIPTSFTLTSIGYTKNVTRGQRVDVALYDSLGNSKWLVHKLGSRIDVIAIPFGRTFPDSIMIRHIEIDSPTVDLRVEVGMNATVVGFPAGIVVEELFPVHKSGKIASEPTLDFAGYPKFLIDCRTYFGMSGSPVYVSSDGLYRMQSTDSVSLGIISRFIGTYSGRIGKPEDTLSGPDIGIVWKPRAIREVIDMGFFVDPKGFPIRFK